MPRYIHHTDGRVYACPECDVGGEVYQRTHRDRDYDHDFKCHKCGAEFDDPVERDAKTTNSELPPGPPTDDDGLPTSLDPDAKELIRSARGSD